jgi:deoxycytidine triphosphate deaminase
MILSDHEIKIRVAKDKLLEFHEPELIKYCGYELTLGKGVEPDTGDLLSIEPKSRWWRALQKRPKCFVVNPSETMIAITKEKLNMPHDLCATYGQLNRWANRGLMLLNTSVVEPGYSGPLTCVLVNFSSQRITLVPGESIAKVNFHSVQGTPDRLYANNLPSEEQYDAMASKMATNLPKSLLDISGVEDRVTKKVNGAVQTSFRLGGIIILFLLLWSQMEGFFSEWIYNRTGLMTTTRRVEMLLQHQQQEFQSKNSQLQREIEILKSQKEQETVTKGKHGTAVR